jgi:hypothetical protein
VTNISLGKVRPSHPGEVEAVEVQPANYSPRDPIKGHRIEYGQCSKRCIIGFEL